MTRIPQQMRAAMLYDVDDLRIETMAVPELEAGDILVQIVASGICSGDLMPWYIRRKAPLVLGHEPCGIVAAVGDGKAAHDRHGRAFSIGDRVAVHHHAPCMQCRFCERGDHVQCARWKSSKIYPGGIAEYVRVPAQNLVDTLHLDDALSCENAVLTEPLACVVKSLRRARLKPGDIVYVIGLGVMGLLHVALAHDRGHVVCGSDFNASRRAVAHTLGADGVFFPDSALASLHDLTDGRGADVVVCGPGHAPALQHAIDSCTPGGTVVMFTPLEPGQHFAFDQSAAYFRDVTLTASYSCGPDDTSEAVALLTRSFVTAEQVGATFFPLEDTAHAYDAMVKGELIKSIVRF